MTIIVRLNQFSLFHKGPHCGESTTTTTTTRSQLSDKLNILCVHAVKNVNS